MLNVALVALAIAIALVQPAPLVQSVDLAMPRPPVYFMQAGRAHFVYELHITNFQQVDVSLTALDVRSGAGALLARYDDVELRRRITRPTSLRSFSTAFSSSAILDLAASSSALPAFAGSAPSLVRLVFSGWERLEPSR